LLLVRDELSWGGREAGGQGQTGVMAQAIVVI
jgi:hypothetical protein